MSDFKIVSVLNPTVILTAGPALSAGTQSQNTGTIVFSNSNGVIFGLNNGTLTASAVGGTGGGAADGYNIVGVNGNSVGSAATVQFSNSNNVSFGLAGSTITATATFNQSVQTQNMVSLNGQTGALSLATGSSLSSSVNGVSTTIGLASNITTALQSAGAYLTTARASNDAIGLNSALTANGVSVTANSSGLSLNFPAFLTTAAQSNHSHGNPTLNLTNLSGTTASNSAGFTLSLSAAAGGGGADGYNILAAGTQTATTAGTVNFVNSNGITFGMSNSTQITASHDGLTTAALSNHSHGVTLNLTNLNGTTGGNSNGITLSLSASVQPVAVSGSNGSFVFSTLSLGNSNGCLFYTTNNSIVASYTVPTVPTSYVSNVNGSSGALSFATGSSLSSSQNGSTITWGLASNITTALQSAGAYLTTAAHSTHSHGNPTLNLTNLSGTTASASNGFTLSLSAAAPGGGGTQSLYAVSNTTQSSSGTYTNALSFAGAGIASVGVTNGSVVVSVPSGGGAGDGVNIVQLGTTGTTGTSWSSLSATVFLNGSNLTVSQNNSNQIVMIAPASSSMVAGNNITLSTNGSTVTVIGGPVFTHFNPYDKKEVIGGQVGQGTLLFDPVAMPAVQFDRLLIPINCTNSSNSSGSHTISYWAGLYTKNGSSLSLLGSTSTSTALTHSGTAGSYSLYSGMRLLTIPWTTTISGSNYWIANVSRTTSGGANGSYSQFVMSQLASNYLGIFGSSANASRQLEIGKGIYSVTTSGLPNAVAFSDIQGSGSANFRPPLIIFASTTV